MTTKIESPFPQELSKKEMLRALYLAGYHFDSREVEGGAKLIGHSKVGNPIYSFQYVDGTKIKTGKLYGSFRDKQLLLDF